MVSSMDDDFLRFDRRIREVMVLAEKELGIKFPNLQKLVRSQSGVYAAKTLLNQRDRFSEGFMQLATSDNLKYSVEAVVLEFRDTKLFTVDEIATAEWRLAKGSQAVDAPP